METDQNGDTFAVCQNCTNLSKDLQKCDSCSAPLADDVVICSNSEPEPPTKRSRMEEATEKSTKAPSGHENEPVPQQLFAAPAPGSNSGPQPVPQTLFINNMNNRGGIVNSTQTTSIPPGPSVNTVHSTLPSINSPQQPIYMNVPVQNVLQSNTGPTGLQPLSQVANARSQLMTTTTVPVLLNQPPPLAPISNQDFQNIDSNQNRNGPTISSHGSRNPACNSEPAKEAVLHFNAYQVRMGSKKFYPSVPVEVKSSGILMTLQGTVKAPVLINARAITMCKTHWGVYPIVLVYLEGSCIRQLRNIFNLSNEVFNAQGTKDIQRRITIFPNLKDSNVSVSQLREMFSSMKKNDNSGRMFVSEITEDETIDIMVESESVTSTGKETDTQRQNTPGPETRSQPRLNGTSAPAATPPSLPMSQGPAIVPPPQAIAPPTGAMMQRHGRPQVPNTIQVSMPMNQTVAMNPAVSMNVQQPLNQLSRFSTQTQSRMMTPAPQTLRTMQQAIPQPIHRTPVSATQHSVVRQQQIQNVSGTQHNVRQQQNMYNGARTPADIMRSQVTNVTRNSPQMANQGLIPVSASDGQHQVVQMPTNQTGWQHLKKTLKKGSIYQVVTQDKQTKFAVWHGENFLFCQVKDTKVELECTNIRIGTMRAALLRPISIEHTGISIAMKADRIYKLVIPTEALAPSFFCIHKRCSCLFIYTTSSGSENIRRTLGMSSMPDGKSNSYYNSKSSVEKYKHIVVYLSNVSSEQRNALIAMKDPSTNQTLFKEIHFLAALKTIEEIDKKVTNEKVVENTGGQESDDDDCIMLAEEVGIKCPYTQKVMKFPIKNKHCGHNYEKEAIFEFINNKKGNARCPYAGCGNRIPLCREDLQDNYELKKIIEKEQKKS